MSEDDALENDEEGNAEENVKFAGFTEGKKKGYNNCDSKIEFNLHSSNCRAI